MKISLRGVLFALLCGPVLFSACASPGQTMTGTVRIYGSEPHTFAGIASEADGRVYLIDEPACEAELRALQGQRLEFRVRIIPASGAYPPADGRVRLISFRPAD